MAATDARPVPKKNIAYRHYFAIRDVNGDLVSTWAGQDSERSLDGAAYADCTNEATEIGTTGTGFIDLTAMEMDTDATVVKIVVTNTDAKDYIVTLYPEDAGDIRSNLTHVNGAPQTATLDTIKDETVLILADTAGIAAIPTTAMRGTDGANTVVPDAAGTGPTVAQFNARTLVAAAYFDPASDTVMANVFGFKSTAISDDFVSNIIVFHDVNPVSGKTQDDVGSATISLPQTFLAISDDGNADVGDFTNTKVWDAVYMTRLGSLTTMQLDFSIGSANEPVEVSITAINDSNGGPLLADCSMRNFTLAQWDTLFTLSNDGLEQVHTTRIFPSGDPADYVDGGGACQLQFTNVAHASGQLDVDYAAVISVTEQGSIPTSTEIALAVDQQQTGTHGPGSWQGNRSLPHGIESVTSQFEFVVQYSGSTELTGNFVLLQDELSGEATTGNTHTALIIDWQLATPSAGFATVFIADPTKGWTLTGDDFYSVLANIPSLSASTMALGVAQAGGTNTITLDPRQTEADGFWVGTRIILIGNTGEGQENIITGWVLSTKVATVRDDWKITPVLGTLYVIEPSTVDVVESNLVSINEDTGAATNLELQFDGTGIVGGSFPSTQDQLANFASGGGGGVKIEVSVLNITTGTETSGTITDTETLNGVIHEITNAAGTTDFYYEADVGTIGVATKILWDGYVQTINDVCRVYYWNWVGVAWAQIGTIVGQVGAIVNPETFDVPIGATDTDGEIRIRFESTDQTLIATDRIWIEFSTQIQQALVFASGTAQGGTADTIQLEVGDVVINDQFVRAKILLIAGTGAGQEAIITDSVASTDTLTVAAAWLVAPDATTKYAVSPAQQHASTEDGGYDGRVYVDTLNGTAGTKIGVSGTSSRPVDNMADAFTIAADSAVNTARFQIAPQSTITLPSDSSNKNFDGLGWTLDLNGQAIANSRFTGANLITGTGTGTNAAFFLGAFGNVTLDQCSGQTMGFAGTFTIGTPGNFNFGNVGGISDVTGIIDFGALNNASGFFLQDVTGGSIEIQNAGAGTGTYKFDMSGNGDLAINANCSDDTEITLRGDIDLTNSSAITTITEVANIPGRLDTLPTEVDTVLTGTHGTGSWQTGGGGGTDRFVMIDTTIDTLSSQTSFTLADGSPDDDAYENCTIVVEDATTTEQRARGLISAYTGGTKDVTLLYDPAIYTMEVGDKVYVLADNSLKATEANRQVVVSATGEISSNIKRINDDAAAAIRLALSAAQIIPGTVDESAFTSTLTEFEAADITEATTNHFGGDGRSRTILWSTGALAGSVARITAYALVGSNGHFTVDLMTEAPAPGDTFTII